MAADRVTKAVLLDALGTLLRLEPPAPRLRAGLRERFGVDVGAEAAARAVRAEISHYRANLHRGTDDAALTDLRRECADVVARSLGLDEDLLDVLLASIVFTPFDDVVPALARWRERGLRLVVVSNWDVSLHEALAATGLRDLLDGAVASAELGVSKPDPRIFRRGLEIAGVAASEALHVGDDLEADVGGARAAGIDAVLLVRDGDAPAAADGVATASSLTALAYPGGE